jgi:2-polyprenyl-3-methyl-5-hydroxy-6-metoxy-1,4-benzoquinol methylase
MLEASRRSTHGPAAPAPRCPVCESASVPEAFAKDGMRYRRCATCGLRFADGTANANFETGIDEYPPAYLQYLDADIADERNHAALLDSVRAGGGALDRGPVLDVGCGSGKLVRFLRDRGVEAYGVEPAEALFARFLAGDGRFFRDIDAAAAATGRPFALVLALALDVLEHVEDPVAFLGSLSAVAAPDGRASSRRPTPARSWRGRSAAAGTTTTASTSRCSPRRRSRARPRVRACAWVPWSTRAATARRATSPATCSSSASAGPRRAGSPRWTAGSSRSTCATRCWRPWRSPGRGRDRGITAGAVQGLTLSLFAAVVALVVIAVLVAAVVVVVQVL